MTPRFKPYFNLDEINAIFNQDDDAVDKFEKEFSKTVGSKYTISFPSGRLGLFSLLETLGFKNNKIITPSYTCIVVPSAIIASKNYPFFVDISLFDYNIEVDEISSMITKDTKCVIPTHMYGNPSDIEKLRDIVGDDIFIIEDAAQALLTRDVGKFGDAVFYSFNIEKQLFTFGGGMVTTNNEEIHEKLRIFRDKIFTKPSFSSELKKTFLLFNTPLIFSDLLFRWILALWNIHGVLSWKMKGWSLKDSDLPVEKIYSIGNYMDSYSRVQAAVGLSQLKKLKTNIKKRIEIAKYYDKKLVDIKGIIPSVIVNGSSFSHYTLRVNNRTNFENFMMRKGVQINKVFDYSTAHLPVFQKYVNKDQYLNNSLTAGKNNVNLPSYPQLLDKKHKLDHIIRSIEEYETIIQ